MIDMRIKQLFFDRPRVQRAVAKAARAALAKSGAYIRRAAKSSIRKRKRSAPPGQPPSSHTGLLRQFIYFGYDPHNESVVVGPMKLNRGTDAPHLLEFGGGVTMQESRRVPIGEIGRAARGRSAKRRRVRIPAGTRLQYAPRPYMGPALEQERPKLPRLWANSVRGS